MRPGEPEAWCWRILGQIVIVNGVCICLPVLGISSCRGGEKYGFILYYFVLAVAMDLRDVN